VTVTIAPSTEACLALVDRINSGTAYALACVAKYSDVEIDASEEVDALRVDVLESDAVQLNETLATDDRTSHLITVWIRDRLPDANQFEIDQRNLLVRQIYERVNDFDSADGRVKVWEVDKSSRLLPDKALLRTAKMFVASVVLRVEVEAPA